MSKKKQTAILGKVRGRRIGPHGSEAVHPSQWYPEAHPGRSQVPYLLHPISISRLTNAEIRRIWHSSDYQGRDFSPFDVSMIPSKYRLAQVLACGLKASVATYSQHWQGMYCDWTFNAHFERALSRCGRMAGGERFVKNAFATVVLFNTGYGGVFMEMLKNRRRLLPPSMGSLENLDMGTFENNLRSAIGAVLGGEYGVNVIRCSLGQNLVSDVNRECYEALHEIAFVPGMDPKGRITCILQIGLKKPQDRIAFAPELMDLAGAKIIERKSERRGADFTREVPVSVMSRFFAAVNHELKKTNLHGVIRTITVEGDTPEGKAKLAAMRYFINQGLQECYEDTLNAYKANLADGMTTHDYDTYQGIALFTRDLGQKVLKPREDAHKMVFLYVDLVALKELGVPIDVAEQTAGNAIQAGLNSVHLEGTTDIPAGQDLLYGSFCLTGPIHSAELMDNDAELQRGWGQGFWHILAPELPPTNKMLALVAIAAKNEQDAFIAEVQAMEERKSVNEIFWYKTWNHPQGKRLDVPQWISYAHVLEVVPIAHNSIPLRENALPEYLPEDHPLTDEFRLMLG